MLEIRNLWVRYRGADKYVLRGVNLSLSGGLVLIVGRTGCGKTTLARCISGLIPHFFPADVKGEIDVLGVNPIVCGIRGLAGRLAYLSQNPEMFVVSLNVEDEIVFPLTNLGVDREDIIRRLNNTVRRLGIEDLLDKNTLMLSSGQLQLVSIASALITGARVLILDEPLARLDPLNARAISRVLREIAGGGRLVVIFEHHLDYILQYADSVVVMDDGEIVFTGSPRKALDLMMDVDVPEIVELFHDLYLEGCVDRIPMSLEEAIEVINNAKSRGHMVQI